MRIKKLRIYGTSPIEKGLWDEIGRVENTKIQLLDNDAKIGKLKESSNVIQIRLMSVYIINLSLLM